MSLIPGIISQENKYTLLKHVCVIVLLYVSLCHCITVCVAVYYCMCHYVLLYVSLCHCITVCVTVSLYYCMCHYVPGGAKRTHVFQIIVTLFIFSIKKLCQHQNNL